MFSKERVTYIYGTIAPENGQLVSVQYGVPNPTPGFPLIPGSCWGTTTSVPYAYQETYTHVAAGAVASKTLTLTTNDPLWPTTASIGVSYTYDTAGRFGLVP